MHHAIQFIRSVKSGLCLLLVAGMILSLSGCATPAIRQASGTTILAPDEADELGGSFLESSDIRTVASKMAASLLQTPELAQALQPAKVAIAPIRNSTRHIIDKDIFSKRLRIELNRYAKRRVRFISQNAGQGVRSEIFAARDEEKWTAVIDQASTAIAKSSVVQKTKDPLRVAVISVRNTNLVNMNADSFTAMIRSKISEKAQGKIVFMSRNKNGKAFSELLSEVDLKNLGVVLSRKDSEIKIAGVDYFLGGEFVAMGETTKTAGSKKPNTARHLNIMLIDANTGEIPVEKMVQVSRKMTSGLAKADFIITGELSALSKASAGGNRSDYVIMSFQLVDPESNEVIWEDAYETKKQTNRSVLYK